MAATCRISNKIDDDDDDDDDDEVPILTVFPGPVDSRGTAKSENKTKTTVSAAESALPTAAPNEIETVETYSHRPTKTSAATDNRTHKGKIPVTILSGFLGSGKTTLINYILKSSDHGRRIAVIENEFGASDGLNIESLIARDGVDPDTSSLTDLIELPNGCVCCTVKDNLVTTLESLVQKRSDLDYILIESSGMANPGPIAALFWLDDELESPLYLDGIVTLVDSYLIQTQLLEMHEASQQIAYADRIILNKLDLIDDAQLQVTLQKIKYINPGALTTTTTYSKVGDLGWVLGTKSFDHIVGYCVPIIPNKHTHTGDVRSMTVSHQGSVTLRKINAWLASLLWPDQDEKDSVLRERLEGQSLQSAQHNNALGSQQRIFRIKGILSVQMEEDERDECLNCDIDPITGLDARRYIVQSVWDVWDIQPSQDSRFSPNEDRSCQLVLIGRNLRDDLRAEFRQCFVCQDPRP